MNRGSPKGNENDDLTGRTGLGTVRESLRLKEGRKEKIHQSSHHTVSPGHDP